MNKTDIRTANLVTDTLNRGWGEGAGWGGDQSSLSEQAPTEVSEKHVSKPNRLKAERGNKPRRQ